jgi:TolA-binding protein
VVALVLCGAVVVLPWSRAAAQDEPATSTPGASAAGGPTLPTYLDLLARRRLLAAETGSVEHLRDLVVRAEELYLDERWDEAALLLYEVAESPRFTDFRDNVEFRGAEYMLAGAMEKLGALRTAERYLDRILARGPEDPYYGPALRRAVDVALAGGRLDAAVARLEPFVGPGAPEDALNELRFLRGRARYDAREYAQAMQELSTVTRRSRFYASAQYLRGAIAAKTGDLREAEARFCEITGTGDREQSTFYVDWRYFEVKDLARLGLGRVAHEARRPDDAFYYYFQVPQDSEHLPFALFEAAYAMYEGDDFDTAIDLLDQLEARFPESPFVAEAAILRGYVHLGRCEFDAADRWFRAFARRFQPIVEELDRVLESPARQARLYDELLEEDRREAEAVRRAPSVGAARAAPREPTLRGTLLGMLRVEPEFFRVHADVRVLDAEAARAGRLAAELEAIRARVLGRDAPRPAEAIDVPADEAAGLRAGIAEARGVLAQLTEQVDAMRDARAPQEEIASIEQALRSASGRLRALEGRMREVEREAARLTRGAQADAAAPAADDLDGLLRADIRAARALPRRVADLRGRLVEVANDAALRAARRLRERLAAELRRARIGRIDAVMGSKRRIEVQIESLAAGRFPPELVDPLRFQGLLRDDEEYWPFDGELWEDEFEQSLDDEDAELLPGAEGAS